MEKIRLAVVGLNMGRNHCKVFHASDGYELTAVCDLKEERIRWVQENVCPCVGYQDYRKMLDEVRPEVVVVATPTALHYEMTVQAVEAGARGVYCEKPMAVDMDTAEKMVSLCRERGVQLIVGHQRRCTSIYRGMKRLIEEGAIGDIYLIRATCAGDFLSDGTHAVDTVRFFMNDQQPEWVLASMFRLPKGTHLWGDHYFTGERYGHSVDSGAQVTIQFPGRVRAEIYTGELWLPGRGYHDVEIFGTKGRMWRAGDGAEHDILIQNDEAGGYRPLRVERTADEAALDGDGHGAGISERLSIANGLRQMMLEGASHPMEGANALKTQEIVMAAYESVRIRNRVLFPLEQKRYPLDIMLENGDMI